MSINMATSSSAFNSCDGGGGDLQTLQTSGNNNCDCVVCFLMTKGFSALQFAEKLAIINKDIDNNGFLDERDFACLALRATIIEGKGEFSFSRLQEYQHIMLSLWEEIAELADFNKDLLQDGKITIDEFKQAVQQCCMGRRYEDFPQAMKMFIDSNFKMVDLNDDGLIAADEYRFNCITKFAIDDVEVVDEAFNNLLSDDDRRRGGLTLSRYQELYAEFLGNPDENCSAVYLFGPLSEFFDQDNCLDCTCLNNSI